MTCAAHRLHSRGQLLPDQGPFSHELTRKCEHMGGLAIPVKPTMHLYRLHDQNPRLKSTSPNAASATDQPKLQSVMSTWGLNSLAASLALSALAARR